MNKKRRRGRGAHSRAVLDRYEVVDKQYTWQHYLAGRRGY